MKRTVILMVMALMVSVAFGQTAKKLIEKYRQLPNATYMDTSKETLKNYAENPDPAFTEKNRAQLKKNFKMSETVQIEKCDEEQRAQIEKDIQALKGYDLLFTTNKNGGSDEEANVLRQMMSEVFNPTIKLQCYGKVKGKTVSDMLMRVDMWETVALMHLDTKVDKELMIRSIMDQDGVSYEQENGGEVVDMKDVLEEVKKGNALFVIDGEEHPELHSLEEAKAYMDAKDFHFNQESWIVGGAVKEKYPHTDKKVVIEWADKSNTSKMSAEEMKEAIMNCVILLNGEYRPEFHNENEVIKYLSDEDGVLNGEYGVHYYFDQDKASKYDKTKKVVVDIAFTKSEDKK
ncbi:MAG: hypothetical protein J5790_04390 [Bacteroidaceae bacterium]|nr:hypothetical protein [Bacteroidaceae bacterium]